jgi:hypothetical protein
MTKTLITGRRGATAAVLAVGGGALAVATWLGGEPGLAVGLVVFYAVCAGLAYLYAGRDTDVGAILRSGGDERQRSLDRDATMFAGLAMIALAIIGSVVSAAVTEGDIGVYGLFAAVGAIAYIVSLIVLRWRR